MEPSIYSLHHQKRVYIYAVCIDIYIYITNTIYI
jgi:hypothetical protein